VTLLHGVILEGVNVTDMLSRMVGNAGLWPVEFQAKGDYKPLVSFLSPSEPGSSYDTSK